MTNSINSLTTILVLSLLVIFGCGRGSDKEQKAAVQKQSATEETEEGRFVITDFVPKVCFENSTKTRVLIVTGPDGKLRSKAEWPSHRLEKIIMGMRIVLGEGEDGSPPTDFFNPPLEELKMPAPSPGFSGGMLSPNWFTGAVHIYLGSATIGPHKFKSDPDYPLTFKVVKDSGYVYLCGSGTVKVKTGEQRVLGQKDTVDFWIKRSLSENELQREAAAQALGYLAIKASLDERNRARKALLILLGDSQYQVRRNAVEAFVRLGSSTDIPILQKMSDQDKNEWVKDCANWAVAQLKNK